jgi:hypothetical protein
MDAQEGTRGAAFAIMTSRSTTGREPSVYTRLGELGLGSTTAVAWHRMKVAAAVLKTSGNLVWVRGVHSSRGGLPAMQPCECGDD